MPLTLTRALLTIIIPGGVAIAPWVLFVAILNPEWSQLYEKYPILINSVVVGVAVIAGNIFEGVGCYIEKSWDNKRGLSDHPEITADSWVDRDWFDYLFRRDVGVEPIVVRYLSRKVTALYFELGIMLAAPWAFVGMFMIAAHVDASSILVRGLIGAAVVAPAVVRFFARDTHHVLCDVRYRLRIDGATLPRD